jgi:type I restriction enzyme R subunit
MTTRPSNFSHLEEHDAQLLRLGLLAEKYFADDPNTCLLKLRQLAELLAQLLASRVGLFESAEETQFDLLRRLQDQGILPREIAQLFNEVRRAGNAASHAFSGDRSAALASLKISWQLGLWFHRTLKDPSFRSGPFIPPTAPQDESVELQAELARLAQVLAEYQATQQTTAHRLQTVERKLQETQDEQRIWEQMATEAEQEKARLLEKLAELQETAAAQPKSVAAQFVQAANTAAKSVQLDEAETRKLIDQQLRQAGWQADSALQTYAKGDRPERGKNKAAGSAGRSLHRNIAILKPAEFLNYVGG